MDRQTPKRSGEGFEPGPLAERSKLLIDRLRRGSFFIYVGQPSHQSARSSAELPVLLFRRDDC
jgi:hypothetical protein